MNMKASFTFSGYIEVLRIFIHCSFEFIDSLLYILLLHALQQQQQQLKEKSCANFFSFPF